jgi:WD40 repeat protein
MNRHFFLVSALVLALAVSSAQVGLAQGKKAPEPGDAVEVSDFGEVKVGKVVEVIGNNAIFKVELEDGKIKPFPARNVRIPKNKAAAARKIAEFGSSKGDNAPSAGVVGKSRTWSDKTGKFKIEASFVELKDGKVKLRKEDGKEVSVDLDKLSEADQEIATLSSQVGNKPVADPDNPFQESEGSGSKVASSNEVQGDPDKAAKITLAAPASWSLTPDAPTGPGVKIPAKSIVLPTRPSKDAFFEGPAGMAINSAKGHIWAMIKQGHGKDAAMRVEVVDAVSGDPVTMFQPAKAFTLMGFSPSGETLCALNDDDFFKKNERVEVYKLVDKELAPVVSLRPYKGKDNWGVKVERALLIDDDHLLTMSDGGYVVVWEIPSAKPLWAVQLKDWGAACALSPSGKQVALHDEAGLFFVEALTGKVLGKLDRPATSDHNVRIAFRPEGQLFAYLAGMQLLVWDLQSGKPIVNEPGMHMQHGHTNTLAFGSDGQSLIVDDEYVIDPQRRIVIAVRAALAVAERSGDPPLVEIMPPPVGFAEELRRLRRLTLDTASAELEQADRQLEYLIGTMIELPRACVRADEIAGEADFFSFGTNDLTQTTLGFSRDDAEGKFLTRYLEDRILDANPFETLDQSGVGDLMRIAVERAQGVEADIKLGICGEHGGDARSVAFCHDLGLDYVSCSPYRVPLARLAAAQAALAERGVTTVEVGG